MKPHKRKVAPKGRPHFNKRSKTPHVQTVVRLDPGVYCQVEQYAAAHTHNNFSEAIRQLVLSGLAKGE